MGPKKKDASEDGWRTVIEEAQLNDERFKVQVILMESAGSEEDIMYLRKFETFAIEAKRFVVKNICQTETNFMVKQLGAEKKVEDPSLRVFEEGQIYLKEKQNIPSDVLALIIKHLIINMKKEYFTVKRQKIEVKKGLRIESSIMLTETEIRGLDAIIPEVEPPPVQTPKKGKNVAEEEIPVPVPGKKYNTALRVAGEEWRDKVYVDDYPLDGPNLYVAVTGFVDPFLPKSLIQIGVPLTAIVQIRIDVNRSESHSSSLIKLPKRGQSQQENLHEKALKFWGDVQDMRLNKNFADFLKDTAFIIYYPSMCDVGVAQAEVFYDELSYLMYDIQDLSRQHVHYLDNMDVIHIPAAIDSNEYFFQYYCRHLSHIPLESLTIYNILDSLLQTVSFMFNDIMSVNGEDDLESSLFHTTTSIFVPTRKLEIAENIVNKFFDTLLRTEDDKKTYRLTYGEEYESYNYPAILPYGDFAKYSLLQVPNVDIDKIIYSALSGSPIHQLWGNFSNITEEIYNKIAMHLNLLLSCFERKIMHLSELYRLIEILACRKLYDNRSSLRIQHASATDIYEFKRIYLKRSILAVPLKRLSSLQRSNILSRSFSKISSTQHNLKYYENDSLSLFYDCPDIVGLVSATELATGKPIDHMIDDFEYFEDYNGTSALQIVLDAFNNYNCVDYKYSEITDSIILMFFNSHDDNGISHEEWRHHIPTPVCLQDFFDFVLEENYEWIFNEDKRMDEEIALNTPLEETMLVPEDTSLSCIDNQEVAAELLIEGSIKYQVEHKTPSVSSIDASHQKDSPTVKPTVKSPATIKSKLSPQTTARQESEIIEVKNKVFWGYDLGNRRVEALGRDSTFFSADGTRVSSSYILLIPENLEYVILNVNPGSAENNFWMHKAISEEVTPDIKTKCDSFRITCKDQILINLVNNSFEIPAEVKPVIKHFHSLYVTWPNGLITKTVHKKHSNEISHIKQLFIMPKVHLREKKRCISLNGDVIKFLNSGEIEVLKPDSTYIKITSYDKHVVPDANAVFADLKSDKSKKPPPKQKVTAPSKNVPIIEEMKNVEYELSIDAFEITETNGIRTSYSNNIPFEIEKYLIRSETEYCLGEKYFRRNDNISTLYNSKGTQTVTFPDGTRIITDFIIEDNEIYLEWSEEEIEYFDLLSNRDPKIHVSEIDGKSYRAPKSEDDDGFLSVLLRYTIEHDDFTTVSINKATNKIDITAANKTVITIDEDLKYEIKLDDMTNAKFDGNYLNINYKACTKCKTYTKCAVNVTGSPGLSVSSSSDSDIKNAKIWLSLKDSSEKKIYVNYEGSVALLNQEVISTLSKSEYERVGVIAHEPVGKRPRSKHNECKEICRAKSFRFIVLRRDYSCSELIHRILVDQYQKSCLPRPRCTIEKYTRLKGYRSLITILKPINLIEDFYVNSIIAIPPKTIIETKGYYQWMRPYERFEPKIRDILKPKPLPTRSAFILRLLEMQWTERIRSKFKGAKELLNAVITYRRVILSNSNINSLEIPIRCTPRFHIYGPEESDYIEKIRTSIINDLKILHKQDMLSRIKLTITTKPLPKRPLVPLEAEVADSQKRQQELLEEKIERERPFKEKRRLRYWAKRAEEIKQEEFYRSLLHDINIPPYFRNMLGGAMWWQINNLVENAATHNRKYF